MAHVQRRCGNRTCRRSLSPGARSCAVCGSREAAWVARYVGADHRERSKSFGRRVDAERYLNAQESAKRTGEWIDPERSSITLGALWLEQRQRPGVRGMPAPSTLAKWDSTWRQHVAEQLGDYPIATLTRQDVRDTVTAVKSPWQAAETLKLVRLLLNRAVDDNRLKANVAARVKAPVGQRREIRVLTPAEISAIVEALPERYRCLVLLDAYSSLRWSELVALKRDDLDLAGRTVRVDEALTEVNGTFHWRKPKTTRSERVVSLPKLLVGPLAAHLLAFPPRPERLIFYGETGQPIRRKTFRRAWIAALRAAGVDEHVRVGWLRHTGASLAYLATHDLKATADRLGHTSTRMVDTVYVKLYDDVAREVADAIDEVVRRTES